MTIDRINQITRRDILLHLAKRDYYDHSTFTTPTGLMKFAFNSLVVGGVEELAKEKMGLVFSSIVHFQQVSDEEFIRFLERVVHPSTHPDTRRIENQVSELNKRLGPDGFQFTRQGTTSGKPIYRLVDNRRVDPEATAPSPINSTKFDIVLSFAGEERPYVERVALHLRNAGISLFYDGFQESDLWGKDLSEHLSQIYSAQARFCVMFISKAYEQKVWTTHERRNAFEKALTSRQDYLLPARFDNTELVGLRRTIGYVDCTLKSPEELGDLILNKLALA